MKKLLYVLTGLCLLAGAFTGCDKPNENTTPLQILDVEGNVMTELYLGNAPKGIFCLKNTESTIVEWAIPKPAEEWLSFSKEIGSLAPGASEQIELRIDRAKLTEGEHEAVVYIGSTYLYIGSTAGTVQLKIRVNRAILENYTETALGMNLQMVCVDFGTFSMGATPEQGSAKSDGHEVTLDGFYIGRFEVTQAQWKAVMGTTVEEQLDKSNEYYGVSEVLYGVGDDYPMYYVSWEEAVAFCDSLSKRTGRKYRLPTEAEWEYAARGGQNADGTKYAGSNTIGDVAWYRDNSGDKTHPVGQKQPNGLGLYDMSGNVSEWCYDWYGSYSSSPVTNPQGPTSGSSRVIRGGGWNDDEWCRVFIRVFSGPGYRSGHHGFRVVCEF